MYNKIVINGVEYTYYDFMKVGRSEGGAYTAVFEDKVDRNDQYSYIKGLFNELKEKAKKDGMYHEELKKIKDTSIADLCEKVNKRPGENPLERTYHLIIADELVRALYQEGKATIPEGEATLREGGGGKRRKSKRKSSKKSKRRKSSKRKSSKKRITKRRKSRKRKSRRLR